MSRTTFLAIATLSIVFTGCSDTPSNASTRPRVTVTTSLLEDAVKRLGGNFVDVEVIMKPGIDPHNYAPTPSDLQKLNSADLILYHGLHLEGKMVDVLGSIRGKKSVAVCERLKAEDLLHASSGDGLHDPHVWMDPTLWTQVIDAVANELVALDPAHADHYREMQRADRTILKSVDQACQDDVKRLPKEQRILVTSHDAFEYLGRHYGFQVRGLQGVSTASETSTKDVQELADFLGRNKVKAVFTETSVPPKGLEAVLDAVKTKYGYSVKLVGGDDALYSDSLGESGSKGDTYEKMLRHNMRVIVDALKSEPPQ